MLAIAVAILLHVLMGGGSSPQQPEAAAAKEEEPEEEPDPPRNFSLTQLRLYDGCEHENRPKFDLDAGKLRIAIKGLVYDVTAGSSFYGPGGSYHMFAGRDASRALAKLSFEEADLANPRVDDLSAHEKDQLNDWITKFEMKRCVSRLLFCRFHFFLPSFSTCNFHQKAGPRYTMHLHKSTSIFYLSFLFSLPFTSYM